MAAPRERPRARKKVIEAPAVSQSPQWTNLRERDRETDRGRAGVRDIICNACVHISVSMFVLFVILVLDIQNNLFFYFWRCKCVSAMPMQLFQIELRSGWSG